MPTEFVDFQAQQDARNTIQLNVRKWTLMLCDALIDNFKSSHPNSDSYKFYIESGRKYHKIIMETDSGNRSVHAFINMKTGELHKAASFKTPVKEPRFDLRIIREREFVLENADWSGGYLYKNAYYTGWHSTSYIVHCKFTLSSNVRSTLLSGRWW